MTQISRFIGTVAAAALLAPSAASAQGATPMPLARAIVSDQVAQTTLFKYQLNSTLARQMVNACIEFGRTQQGGPRGYAIFVLAPNGDIIDAHVGDGVVPIGVETGMMKAKTALYARTPSSVVASRFPTLEGRAIRMDLGRDQGLSYYFVGGGVPIVLVLPAPIISLMAICSVIEQFPGPPRLMLITCA
jgi:uncharacterized protein GlcG (DUF336 family)